MATNSTTLDTSRLRIVPFSERHLTRRYVGWLNDPVVTAYSENRHCHHTIEECEHYLQHILNSDHHFWAIEVKRDGLHIGNITATVDVPNRVADIAIMIGERDTWGMGYGTESFSSVCDYLLTDGGMRKVTVGTMAENTGMMEIMRKAGMAEEGRRRKHFLLDGREVDLVYAARFSPVGGLAHK